MSHMRKFGDRFFSPSAETLKIREEKLRKEVARLHSRIKQYSAPAAIGEPVPNLSSLEKKHARLSMELDKVRQSKQS